MLVIETMVRLQNQLHSKGPAIVQGLEIQGRASYVYDGIEPDDDCLQSFPLRDDRMSSYFEEQTRNAQTPMLGLFATYCKLQ